MTSSHQARLEVEHMAGRARARALSGRLESAARLLASRSQHERIAGVALLHGLWNEEAELGEPVEDVLAAFVRRRAVRLEAEQSDNVAPDVQAALSALGDRPATLQNRPLDLTNTYLRGVEWPLARLQGAHLNATDLRGALLVGADLSGAWLRDANLYLANLEGADLRGADLRGALGCDQRQLSEALSDEGTHWPLF